MLLLLLLLTCACHRVSASVHPVSNVVVDYNDTVLTLSFVTHTAHVFQQRLPVVNTAVFFNKTYDNPNNAPVDTVKPRTFLSYNYKHTVTVLNRHTLWVQGLVTINDVLFFFEHNATDSVLLSADEFETDDIVCNALDAQFTGRRLRLAAPWLNCFTPTPVSYKVGMIVDLPMYQFLQSVGVEPEIYAIQQITQANVIYVPQVTIQLVLTTLLVIQTNTADFFTPCHADMDLAIKSMVQNTELFSYKNVGYWHQFTDCKYPGSVLGMAYVDTACTSPNNVGISKGTYALSWLIFAHEIGHHFGARHTFQNGRGTTGGLMDYTAKPYEGAWQFNSQFSENDLCKILKDTVAPETCTTFTTEYPILPVTDPGDLSENNNTALIVALAVGLPVAFLLVFFVYTYLH